MSIFYAGCANDTHAYANDDLCWMSNLRVNPMIRKTNYKKTTIICSVLFKVCKHFY